MVMNATSCQAPGEERALIQGCPCLHSWAAGLSSTLASPPMRWGPQDDEVRPVRLSASGHPSFPQRLFPCTRWKPHDTPQEGEACHTFLKEPGSPPCPPPPTNPNACFQSTRVKQCSVARATQSDTCLLDMRINLKVLPQA